MFACFAISGQDINRIYICQFTMPDNVSFAFHTERVPASALFFGFVLFLASPSHSRLR
ncbi:hypothetical protein B4096_2898 [Heyndrickxia coagulans]|nr:hypothetical protein B4096_2898 [Heyndrickxia coagulans]